MEPYCCSRGVLTIVAEGAKTSHFPLQKFSTLNPNSLCAPFSYVWVWLGEDPYRIDTLNTVYKEM